MKHLKFRIILYVLLAGIAAGFLVHVVRQRYATPTPQIINDDTATYGSETLPNTNSTTSKPTAPTSPSPVSPPTTFSLKVPFTAQAPTGNWDTIHNEDCEEASAIMANAYYNGPHDVKLDPGYVEGQLTKLTDWEMQTFGYNLDINSTETVQMIEANFDLQAKVVTDYNQEFIKNELLQNHVVLLPANGQLLGNPNYKQPGPKYHMLVIRGFTSTSIITNDSGTRNGLNYSYSYNTLYNANGEWSHQSNSVDLNKKHIIVVWK